MYLNKTATNNTTNQAEGQHSNPSIDRTIKIKSARYWQSNSLSVCGSSIITPTLQLCPSFFVIIFSNRNFHTCIIILRLTMGIYLSYACSISASSNYKEEKNIGLYPLVNAIQFKNLHLLPQVLSMGQLERERKFRPS